MGDLKDHMKFKKFVYESLLLERTVDTPNGPLLDANGKPVEVEDEPKDTTEKGKKDASTTKTKDTSKAPPDNLLTEKQQKMLLKHPTSIVNMLKEGQVEAFKNFNRWQPQVQQRIVDSINDRGTEYKSNPILSYFKYLASSGSTVPINGNLTQAVMSLFEDAFDNGSLTYTNINLKNNKYDWMLDNDSYKADDDNALEFKIKALILLSSKRAGDFGNTKKIPFDEIKELTSKDKIISLLDRWQRQGGKRSSSNGSSGGSRRPSGTGSGDQKKLAKIDKPSEAIKNFANDIGGDKGSITVSKRDLIKRFQQLAKSGKTFQSTYSDLLQSLFFVPKETETQKPSEEQKK